MQVGGGEVEFLTEKKIPLRNVPGVLKRPKNKKLFFFLRGGGGGEKFLSFFSLLKFFFSKMFLGF